MHVILLIYATMVAVIVLFLFLLDGEDAFNAIVNSLRITGVICVSASPLFYIATENLKFAIAIGISGIMTLVLVLTVFWPTLYPKHVPQPPKSRRDKEADAFVNEQIKRAEEEKKA